MKKKSTVASRLNALFFIVFILFSLLIFRLGVVQLIHGEDYERKVAKADEKVTDSSVPRGEILDRNGEVIVDNTLLRSITYTKPSGTSSSDVLEIARALAKVIDVDTSKVTERDKKDYWLQTASSEEIKELISEEEMMEIRQREDADAYLYKRQLEEVGEEQIGAYDGDKDKDKDELLEVIAISGAMTSGYANMPQTVDKDVTLEEYATISENLDNLPGVNVGTDWERSYPNGETFRSVIGNITDTNEGLPRESLDYYLARDYSRNDRVGKSYIEYAYEDILKGQKEKAKTIKDKSGNVIGEEIIQEGRRGDDVYLTIDMELQKEVEKILEEELIRVRNSVSGTYVDRGFVVIMDPRTGEILSLAGKQLVKGKDGNREIRDYALGTFTSAYEVGSSVKGATVLAGYNTGAIGMGTVLYDRPLTIAGTPTKASYKNMGYINDLTALSLSSNVYMFETVIRMGGGYYVPNKPLLIDPKAFDTLRNYYAQFGLGVPTGINLPNEFVGLKGAEKKPGFLLDLSIGQYDTYTTLQLAQYVSTLANDGYRIKPQIIKEIREPEGVEEKEGRILYSVKPEVLNKVDATQEQLDRIGQGFRMVMTSGTGSSHFANSKYKVAGKTGTAETRYYDNPGDYKPEVENLTFVGYAPYDNPVMSFAVVVPATRAKSTVNKDISKRVVDTYFEIYEKEAKKKSDEETSEE